MRFTPLGGATAIIEHRGIRMLLDPWLDDGIFHGAWHHFPPAALRPEQLGPIDYVYISHVHEDHCSPGTLRHLDARAELILMERSPDLVAQLLEANGLRFARTHLVAPRTPREIAPGLLVDMVEPDPANEMSAHVDSSLLVRWDGLTIYDANDCQPHADGIRYLKSVYGRIDLALLPYSGGSGYPACYVNLSDEEKSAERDRIIAARLRSFAASSAELDARRVMPFADQYVVGGTRAARNRHVAHPPGIAAALAALRERGLGDAALALDPGQGFDLATGEKDPPGGHHEPSEDDRRRHIERLPPAPYEHELADFGPAFPLAALIDRARANLLARQQRADWFPDLRYYLDAGEHRFRIDLRHERAEAVDPSAPLEQPFLRVAGSEALMIMLLSGRMSWNIADAALFLDYERRPNVYVPRHYVFLNHLALPRAERPAPIDAESLRRVLG